MGPHVIFDRKIACLTLLLGALGLFVLSVVPGDCQTNIVSVSHPGGLTVLEVEDPALILTEAASGTTPAQFVYRPAGRFRLSTGPSAPTGGDPTRIGDENATIASVLQTGQWASQFSSKTTIAIDPVEGIGQEDGGYFYDIHQLMDSQEDAAQADLINFWTAQPTAGSRDISGTYRLPVAFDDDDNPTAFIEVKQILSLVGDSLMVENIVRNTDSVRHRFGVRVLFDGRFGGGSSQDGQAIILPDGNVLTSETELPDARYSNGILPETWVTYDDPANPNLAIRGSLSTDAVFDAGTANRSAGLPDSIAWGQMRNIGAAGQYYFSPNAQASLVNEDWGYAVRWDAIELSPGQACRYVTYYGVGASTPDYNSPYAFMVYAPFSLQQAVGDDPATPGTVEQYYLTDGQGRSPFPVSAYIDNFGADTLLDASVRIRLPLGLELAPGETLQKSTGIVRRNEMKSITWMVRATAARPGRYDIKFTGPQGKVLNRSISIPALPVLNPLESPRGIEMVSIPYEFMNSDAEWVFQDLGSLQPGGNATVVRWEASTGQYRWFPDPIITNIEPGKGFWLLNLARDVVNLPIDATPVAAEQSFSVELAPGWNQIGLPFTSSQALDAVRVIGPSGGQWSMMEAYNRLILVPTVFEYDPVANDYVWNPALSEARMDPFSGYWILAYQPCTLLFPPPSLYAPAEVGLSSALDTEPEGWQMTMTAYSGDRVSRNRGFGVAEDGKVGFDQHDLPEPPAAMSVSANTLNAAFLAGNADTNCARLAVDTRPVTPNNTWRYAVTTGSAGQMVTLEWGDLSALPGNLVADIVDTTSGNRVYMRTASALQYCSRVNNETRIFEIAVRERSSKMLSVSNVSATAVDSGKVAFVYSLSAPAKVDIAVRNISGIEVGRAETNGVSTEGTHTVVWSGQNLDGAKVPSGSYICQITAVCPETGQAVNVLRMFNILP